MLNITTKQAFREGMSIRVDGCPARIDTVNSEQGIRVEFKIPGLYESDGATAVIVSNWISWDSILTAIEDGA